MKKWGHSSVGRAPALQAGGQEFESPCLHHISNITSHLKRVIQSRRVKYEGAYINM